jgi:hypothetical protein
MCIGIERSTHAKTNTGIRQSKINSYIDSYLKIKVMTVQDLINELNKVENKNLKVVVQGCDPTDWVYNNDVEGVGVQNVYDDEIGYRRRFVIDGGMF